MEGINQVCSRNIRKHCGDWIGGGQSESGQVGGTRPCEAVVRRYACVLSVMRSPWRVVIRQVTYEPMCVFKRWLWFLMENKLYGAKGEAVGWLLIGAIQAKDDGGLDQDISSGDGEKRLGSGCVFNWCLTGLVDGLEGERKQGIQDVTILK